MPWLRAVGHPSRGRRSRIYGEERASVGTAEQRVVFFSSWLQAIVLRETGGEKDGVASVVSSIFKWPLREETRVGKWPRTSVRLVNLNA